MIIGLLSLSGCSGGNEERVKPVAALPEGTSASAPLPAKATPTATSPKAAPTGPTPESATAFVRAYYAAVNKSAMTGRPEGLGKYT